MADSTKPTDTGAAAPAAQRPIKPDEASYKKDLKKAEDAHAESMKRYNAIREKIELVQPNRNKDKDAQTPTQKKRQELIARSKEIRQKQAGGKSGRTAKLDQIKRLDEQLRSRINEQKNAKAKVPFKSAEDVDREIEKLDRQVNGGMMKLVDEKKALAEISSLRKQRKTFAQFDEAQKQIDDLRAKIKEIKDSMDDPEAKKLSEEYNKIQAELDATKAEQDEAYKNLSSLRDERTKLQAEQQEKFQAIRELKNSFFAQKRAFNDFEREQKQKAWERHQAERDRVTRDRKRENAQRILNEASDPAYLEEIRRARTLLRFLDPSQVDAEKSPLMAESGMTAQAQRKVDGSDIKGMKMVKKEDRDDDYLPAVKKGKKGKKTTASTGADAGGKFSLPPAVMEDCSSMGINPPMSSADVPAVVQQVKQKLEHWQSDQAAQTQRNIDKAKKEIERLDAEDAEGAEGSGTATPKAVNGKKDDTTDAGMDKATKDLSETSLEEQKEEVTA